MSSIEGRSTILRTQFEERYQGDLALFRLAIAAEPEKETDEYTSWSNARSYLGTIKEQDPRRWQILRRLATPIVERLIEERKRILKEREKYTPGVRKRTAQMYEEEIQGVRDDYGLAQMMEDMRPRPDLGGFTSEGIYIPPTVAPEDVEPAPDITLNTDLLSFLEETRDKYRRPLTDEERRKVDHDLG